MSGQKKQKLVTPDNEAVKQGELRLADLQRRVYVFHKAGFFDTVWDAQIIQLETLIDGAKSPEAVGVKDNLEVETDGT